MDEEQSDYATDGFTVSLSKSQKKRLRKSKRLQASKLNAQYRADSSPSSNIKILYWNARGFGNLDTRLLLKKLCLEHKPDFLFLAEPFITSDQFPS